jgi:hypothetical protein
MTIYQTPDPSLGDSKHKPGKAAAPLRPNKQTANGDGKNINSQKDQIILKNDQTIHNRNQSNDLQNRQQTTANNPGPVPWAQRFEAKQDNQPHGRQDWWPTERPLNVH